MAVKVLAGTKVSDIPVKVFDDLDTYINTKTAVQIGFEFSPEFLCRRTGNRSCRKEKRQAALPAVFDTSGGERYGYIFVHSSGSL